MKLAIAIIKSELQQREHANKHDHLRKADIQAEIDSLNKALSTLEMFTKAELEQPDLPAENTVMWWLCRIADDEIRRKAVGKCIADNFGKNGIQKAESVNEAIWDGWSWEYGEGVYWRNMADSEIPLLPSPEWKEYLELKNK